MRDSDLNHKLLHVVFPLEDEGAQVVERDVVLHVLSKAMILHIDLCNRDRTLSQELLFIHPVMANVLTRLVSYIICDTAGHKFLSDIKVSYHTQAKPACQPLTAVSVSERNTKKNVSTEDGNHKLVSPLQAKTCCQVERGRQGGDPS